MKISKSKIDKAGQALAKDSFKSADEYVELESIFDAYRRDHLQPLTETTMELQRWLSAWCSQYYIAQRLKRKPQIIRKLNRLSVRLTQLQDIGGFRIIVDDNRMVDTLSKHILERVKTTSDFRIYRTTDYRVKGRDDTGYRSLHMIFSRDDLKLELQIRSKIQHYWAEGVERASVIYGHQLKESEGDSKVLKYFQLSSNIFYEIESGREPTPAQKLSLDVLRQESEATILATGRDKDFFGHVNINIIKTLSEIESNSKSSFNNWIIVFDWASCSFVDWAIISREPDTAIKAYVEKESQYPAAKGYEVVLVGSSDVETISKTHSHYFGIEKYEGLLEKLDASVISLSKRMDIDTGARQILLPLVRKKFWGKKTMAISTLKNHYCKNVLTFDHSLQALVGMGLVILHTPTGPVSLNLSKKARIDGYI